MIIDYSFWRPARDQLAGVNGAVRYLSHDPAKHVTAAELVELHAWGIGTALVFEDTGTRATAGAAAGSDDGTFARATMTALGVPGGRPCFAAVDFDVPDYAPTSRDPRAKLGPVGDYLAAFAGALRPYPLGVYGGYWLVSRAMDARLAALAWQTVAWSGGNIDARIALFQPAITPPGMQADLDLAGHRDWGQFRRVTSWLAGADA